MAAKKILAYLLFVCGVISAAAETKKVTAKRPNLRPVIGIVSQKVTSDYTPKITESSTYIAASYVKFMEMAGAQVVPLLPSYSKKKLLNILQSINGVLFPGGSAPLYPNDSGYATVTELVYKTAIGLNDKGVHFPIMGICLGFETLHALASKSNEDTLSPFDAENMPVPLNLTKHAFESRMLDGLSKKLMQSLMFSPVTLNMHKMGISPDVYKRDKHLMNMFRVLSTNLDYQGKEFVSTIEGIRYPFYGTQWHPEKNIFEWTREERIAHFPDAIKVSQELANFFVNEARRNNQHFDTEKEEVDNSIFIYEQTYSGGRSLFEQVYIFGNSTEKYTT